jgi:DNA-binding HxlR family transcriptional regulator
MRRYNDPCGIARALNLVGERWALLVVRELLLGPKRFTDLRHGLRGVSDNVLSQRLRELEQAAVVRRRKLAPPSSAWSYQLTERGYELESVLTALGRWGSRLPVDGSTNPDLSVDALVVALRTTFDAEAAGSLTAGVQLRLGDDRFRAEVDRGRFQVVRGEADAADLTITTDAPTLQSLVFAGRPLAQAEQAGEATIVGDRRIAERFLRCFPPSVRPAPRT